MAVRIGVRLAQGPGAQGPSAQGSGAQGPSAHEPTAQEPGQPGDLGEWLADAAAFDAAGADALWVDVPRESQLDPLALTAALAPVTFRSLLVTTVLADAAARTVATVGLLSRGRLRLVAEPGGFRRIPGDPEVFEHDPAERWVCVPSPDGRESWRAILADTAARGYHGLVVPADVRLLDILRNPEDPGERLDLQLAMG